MRLNFEDDMEDDDDSVKRNREESIIREQNRRDDKKLRDYYEKFVREHIIMDKLLAHGYTKHKNKMILIILFLEFLIENPIIDGRKLYAGNRGKVLLTPEERLRNIKESQARSALKKKAALEVKEKIIIKKTRVKLTEEQKKENHRARMREYNKRKYVPRKKVTKNV